MVEMHILIRFVPCRVFLVAFFFIAIYNECLSTYMSSMEDFLTTISIEVADDELQLIKQHLDNCGITLPEFARQAMLSAIDTTSADKPAAINRQQLEGDIDHTAIWNKLGA